ncbi:unnamed protein product, partial [Polarella glacialis]
MAWVSPGPSQVHPALGRRELLGVAGVAGLWALPLDPALASGGSTAGKYSTIPSAKRRFFGRVRQGIFQFLEMGKAIEKGDLKDPAVDSFYAKSIIKQIGGESMKNCAFSACVTKEKRTSRWLDFKTASDLLGSAFRYDASDVNDYLPQVRIIRAYAKKVEKLQIAITAGNVQEAQTLYTKAKLDLSKYTPLVELLPLDSEDYTHDWETLPKVWCQGTFCVCNPYKTPTETLNDLNEAVNANLNEGIQKFTLQCFETSSALATANSFAAPVDDGHIHRSYLHTSKRCLIVGCGASASPAELATARSEVEELQRRLKESELRRDALQAQLKASSSSPRSFDGPTLRCGGGCEETPTSGTAGGTEKPSAQTGADSPVKPSAAERAEAPDSPAKPLLLASGQVAPAAEAEAASAVDETVGVAGSQPAEVAGSAPSEEAVPASPGDKLPLQDCPKDDFLAPSLSPPLLAQEDNAAEPLILASDHKDVASADWDMPMKAPTPSFKTACSPGLSGTLSESGKFLATVAEKAATCEKEPEEENKVPEMQQPALPGVVEEEPAKSRKGDAEDDEISNRTDARYDAMNGKFDALDEVKAVSILLAAPAEEIPVVDASYIDDSSAADKESSHEETSCTPREIKEAEDEANTNKPTTTSLDSTASTCTPGAAHAAAARTSSCSQCYLEANNLFLDPTDSQKYCESCWTEYYGQHPARGEALPLVHVEVAELWLEDILSQAWAECILPGWPPPLAHSGYMFLDDGEGEAWSTIQVRCRRDIVGPHAREQTNSDRPYQGELLAG